MEGLYSFSLACGMCNLIRMFYMEQFLTRYNREMAVGNTFGATALSSYGGFWISFAIILTPGGFNIEEGILSTGGEKALFDSLGFYLMVSCSTTPLVLNLTLSN